MSGATKRGYPLFDPVGIDVNVRGVEYFNALTGNSGAGFTTMVDKDITEIHDNLEKIESDLVITNTVYGETNTSATPTVRTVNILGISSLTDLINKPIFIRSAANGTAEATTLNVNGYGAKEMRFPHMTGNGGSATPPAFWSRASMPYCVVYNGTYFYVLNTQFRSASADYPGIVQLYSGIDSASNVIAATAGSVKTAYDRGSAGVTAAATAQTAANAAQTTANTAQTTANAAIPSTQKGAANGVASLDASKLVPVAQLPSASTSAKGAVQLYNGIDSTSATLAATAAAVRTAYNQGAAAALSTTVYPETNASNSYTVRTVEIAGVTSYNQLADKPIFIRPMAYGTAKATTLEVNGLGAKSIVFPNPTGSSTSTVPPAYWTRGNLPYCVMFRGSSFYLLNTQFRSASTTYPGIVQLDSTVTSISTTLAATASAVKTAYDRGTAGVNAAAALSETGTWTPVLSDSLGGGAGNTYSAQNGRFARAGKIVTASCRMMVTGSVPLTGYLMVAGLPYAIASQVTYVMATMGWYSGLEVPSGNTLCGMGGGGKNGVILYILNSRQVQYSDLKSFPVEINLTITYPID